MVGENDQRLKLNEVAFATEKYDHTWYGGGGPRVDDSFASLLSLPRRREISSAVGDFRQLPIL